MIVVAGCQTAAPPTSVTTFDECVDAGYDIWATSPLECRSPEGEIFIIDAELPYPIPLPASNNEPTPFPISNFQECLEAGNPAMESHPRQCMADGQTFTEEI